MTAQAQALSISTLEYANYRIEDVGRVLTPALAIYREIVDSNISVTLGLLGGNPDRWRPHVKTAKLASIMSRMVQRGILNFKCSTTLELATICEVGGSDALLAYPAVGMNASRVRQLAGRVSARVSALVENVAQIEPWMGSNVGLFIDVNPGMDRTGIEQDHVAEIVRLAQAIASSGLVFRGLHYYDGHLSKYDLGERDSVAHRGYDRLIEIVSAIENASLKVDEVITAGTPAFPCTLSYSPFSEGAFTHRASPGTVVYNDCSSLAQLSSEYGYRPAALVVSTVVSHPSQRRLTCDAGHKTVSADSGVPTCAVLGRPDLVPAKPSEEHMPIDSLTDSEIPPIGDTLYLVPQHVCPTVNNFDHAIIVDRGRIAAVERVTARGRESPLVGSE